MECPACGNDVCTCPCEVDEEPLMTRCACPCDCGCEIPESDPNSATFVCDACAMGMHEVAPEGCGLDIDRMIVLHESCIAYLKKIRADRGLNKKNQETLQVIMDDIASKRLLEAADKAAYLLDSLFLSGEFESAKTFLDGLRPHDLPPVVLTGICTVSWHARTELGSSWKVFLNQTLYALEHEWKLDKDRMRELRKRFL